MSRIEFQNLFKIMVHFSHFRLYLGNETVSCHLFLRMTRMNMDLKLERLGKLCQVLLLCQQKSLKKLLWLVLPDEVCLISSSQLYRSILCMGKGTN